MFQRFLFLLLFIISSIRSFSQHQDKVDFVHGKILIVPNTEQNQIWGHVTYEFEVLSNVDSVFLDAKNMEFSQILLNNKKAKHNTSKKIISIFKKFKKGKTYTVTLEFKAKPKQAVYFIGTEDDIEGNEQIWTQGQGKYTSHWLPSFDDMNEKVEFDLTIVAGPQFEVISNGKLMGKEFGGHEMVEWRFDMQQPMSSYLLAFAIGNYKKQKLTSTSGIPIENYYYPKDSVNVESTYRFTKEIFDFLEDEIRVPYPWQNYKQIPVHDFLYAGMENTTATIFSDGYVIDSTAFIDKNYVNVNAHEMAHQWFGDLVTEKDGNHHWLHEGFATYYAYLAEKELFGGDYFYWKLYDTAKQLQQCSVEGKGEALTNPKASSLTFYEKGAWALVMLREQLGEAAFKKGVQCYLNKHQFKNVTTTDFLNELETSSKTSLSSFKKDWLERTEFRNQEVLDYLTENSEEIKYLLEFEKSLNNNAHQQDSLVTEYWSKGFSEDYKYRFVNAHFNRFNTQFIGELIKDSSIKVRQAVAIMIKQIPAAYQQEFENLLQDKSYVTIEHALMKLWVRFPDKRAQYLEQTKDIIGLPNKNVRLLWLTLAVLTTEYGHNGAREYVNELMGYTSPVHSWETRMGAFQYLFEALSLNNTGIKNLLEATTHHSWQFRKYARHLVDELLKDSDYRVRIMGLIKELNEEELRYLKTKMDIK